MDIYEAAFTSKAEVYRGWRYFRKVPIVLQNSFWVTEDKFSEPCVWRSNNYLEGYLTKAGSGRFFVRRVKGVKPGVVAAERDRPLRRPYSNLTPIRICCRHARWQGMWRPSGDRIRVVLGDRKSVV